MKIVIKLYSHIFLAFLFVFASIFIFYQDYKSVNDLEYLLTHLLTNKSFRYSLLFFCFAILIFICTVCIEIGYDKESGVFYQKILRKREVKCSEIAFLVYVGGAVGDIYVMNKYQNTILYMSKVFHKKKILKLFNEIKKDYPSIEIIS